MEKADNIEMVALDELLKKADIVTLHVPLTESTVNMVNENFIAKMKGGSYLVNVSRGEIVDEQALLFALENGKLAGAALDVFKEEPYIGSLTKVDNVILTAHMGSYACEARIKMESQAVDNLLKNIT